MEQNDIILNVSLEDTNLIIQLSLVNHLIECPVDKYRVYDVVLTRMDQNGTKAFECLSCVTLKLVDFLENHPQSILYFYCDDVHDLARRDRNISMQEYRHRLFSKMFNHLRRRVSKSITDEPIIREIDGKMIFIHLIYFDDMRFAADELKQIISEQTTK